MQTARARSSALADFFCFDELAMSSRFTVAMTVFRTFEFVPRAVACVLNQELASWELLIVVDGAVPEDEKERFDRLLTSARSGFPRHRIEVFETPRAEGCWGNRARRFALSQARSDYIAWVNHDNLIFPNFLATHAANIARSPGCVSVVDIDYWRDERRQGRFPRALARSRIDLLNFAVPVEVAREVDAFGEAMERVYAADWLTYRACAARRPVERVCTVTGVHF